jgi:DNA-binding transcriptional LysR family regulator
MVGRQLPGGRIIDSLISPPLEPDAGGPFLEVQSGVIACAMAAEGLGIAIVDSLTISGHRDERLAIRPLEPAIELRYSVLATRGRTDDRLLASFHAALDTAAHDLAATTPYVTALVGGRLSPAASAAT